MTLTVIYDIDMRTSRRFFSNLSNYQALVFKFWCGHMTHTGLPLPNAMHVFVIIVKSEK